MEIKEQKITDNLVLLKFEDAAQPVFKEVKGKPYIYYGQKNDYPQYLLYLYNNSSKHSAIINGKRDYVVGKGFIPENENDAKAKEWIQSCNQKGESLNDVLEKLELDVELFEGGYLNIVWSKAGQIASIYHVDYSHVRSDEDNKKFFIADDWVTYKDDGTYTPNTKPKYKEFNAFDPNVRTGSVILYCKKYHPGIKTYTLPTYRGSITWIEVDVEIGTYHLNNVKGGFFANKIINLNNGIPEDEKKKTIETQWMKKFGGVRGQKWILSFNIDPAKATTVTDLSIAESDKLFDLLNKTTQGEIFTGHRITSPMLFGVKTEGQLGGRNELREASELFQNTYVNGRQQWLEKVFNMLAPYAGVKSKVVIQRTEPIAYEYSETAQLQALTPEELRDRLGLPPVEKSESEKAKETVNAINSLSPLVANKVLEVLTETELRALVGLGPATEPIQRTPPAQFSAEEDAADLVHFETFGQHRRNFRILQAKSVMFTSDTDEWNHFAETKEKLSTLQQKIIDAVNAGDRDAKTIATRLRIDIDDVQVAIETLIDEGLMTSSKGKLGVKSTTTSDRKSIEIMYSYEGPKDSRNRPFCARMMELNRLYSRKDIESISERLGYSVWTRRGGWYTIPGTNEHRPYCRHSWRANVVVKSTSR